MNISHASIKRRNEKIVSRSSIIFLIVTLFGAFPPSVNLETIPNASTSSASSITAIIHQHHRENRNVTQQNGVDQIPLSTTAAATIIQMPSSYSGGDETNITERNAGSDIRASNIVHPIVFLDSQNYMNQNIRPKISNSSTANEQRREPRTSDADTPLTHGGDGNSAVMYDDDDDYNDRNIAHKSNGFQSWSPIIGRNSPSNSTSEVEKTKSKSKSKKKKKKKAKKLHQSHQSADSNSHEIVVPPHSDHSALNNQKTDSNNRPSIRYVMIRDDGSSFPVIMQSSSTSSDDVKQRQQPPQTQQQQQQQQLTSQQPQQQQQQVPNFDANPTDKEVQIGSSVTYENGGGGGDEDQTSDVTKDDQQQPQQQHFDRFSDQLSHNSPFSVGPEQVERQRSFVKYSMPPPIPPPPPKIPGMSPIMANVYWRKIIYPGKMIPITDPRMIPPNQSYQSVPEDLPQQTSSSSSPAMSHDDDIGDDGDTGATNMAKPTQKYVIYYVKKNKNSDSISGSGGTSGGGGGLTRDNNVRLISSSTERQQKLAQDIIQQIERLEAAKGKKANDENNNKNANRNDNFRSSNKPIILTMIGGETDNEMGGSQRIELKQTSAGGKIAIRGKPIDADSEPLGEHQTDDQYDTIKSSLKHEEPQVIVVHRTSSGKNTLKKKQKQKQQQQQQQITYEIKQLPSSFAREANFRPQFILRNKNVNSHAKRSVLKIIKIQ